jgi:Cdc6-like AAA superfamily ATPase
MYSSISKTIERDIRDVTDQLKNEEYLGILEWLSPTDFPAQQHDIISRRQEGTGQWFLNSLEFKRWLQVSKTLFCPGIPGAGKTMMAAIAIDHLHRNIQSDDIGVAYLFCSYKARVDQSAASLFAAILKQLVQNRPELAKPVRQMHEFHLRRGSKLSLGDILQALQSVFSAYITIFIVVDALDECPDRDGTRGQLIDKLHELQAKKDVHLLFTSRLIPKISLKLQSTPTLEVRASEQDVRRFMDGQIPRLPNFIQRDEKLKDTIQDEIVKAVDGM